MEVRLPKISLNLNQTASKTDSLIQTVIKKKYMMQQHAQSISNQTNGFSKTGGQASQLSMSNSLNIDGGKYR